MHPRRSCISIRRILNLARVYALEGARDKARGVLLDLLKQHPDHRAGKADARATEN